MGLKPIGKKPSIVQMVVQQILTQVSTGKLKPGDTLPITSELAKGLMVTSTTLRESLKILETKGVVEILPRKGIRIRPAHKQVSEGTGFEVKLSFDRSYLLELVETLFVHIVGGAPLVCRNRKPAHIKELRRIVGAIQDNVQQLEKGKTSPRRFEAYKEHYRRFYSTTARATENRVYVEVMEALLRNIMEYIPLMQAVFGQDIPSLKRLSGLDHEFLRAVEAGDPEQAVAAAGTKVDEMKKIMWNNLLARENASPMEH
jgi:GntR family transcriptional regulator, transcriptional repressor for pyruvate dehydrogenase complex